MFVSLTAFACFTVITQLALKTLVPWQRQDQWTTVSSRYTPVSQVGVIAFLCGQTEDALDQLLSVCRPL